MKKKSILFLSFCLSAIFAHGQDNTRAVPITGAANFRDLGGYETKQGTHVKWGKLYRSGEISKLSNEDIALMTKRHINFVVDFRSDDEVSKAKDRLPVNTGYLQLSAGSENLNGWATKLAKLNSADSLMESFYGQTSHLKAKYQPFFKELLKQPDSSALLFHCTAGKDRTGIGAALLLYSLGVPEETILNDYLLSNEYRKAENERMIKGMTQMGVKEQVAKDLAGVKREYLLATYNALVSKYGSIDSFLKTEMELSDADLATLKKKYTN